MNAESGAVIATFPIGGGTDFAVFDPKRELAFSSNRDGTLSVVAELSPDKFVALAPIPTEWGARTVPLDPSIGRMYLVTANMTVNKSAAPNDFRHRYRIMPGSGPAVDPRQGHLIVGIEAKAPQSFQCGSIGE